MLELISYFSVVTTQKGPKMEQVFKLKNRPLDAFDKEGV